MTLTNTNTNSNSIECMECCIHHTIIFNWRDSMHCIETEEIYLQNTQTGWNIFKQSGHENKM